MNDLQHGPEDETASDAEVAQARPVMEQPGVALGTPGGTALLPSSPFESGFRKYLSDRMAFVPSGVSFSTFLLSVVLRFFLRAFIYYAWPDTGVLWLQAGVELGLAIVALLPALLMSRIENRPFAHYGLPLRNAFGKLFWAGILWGFGSITILLLALHGANAFDFGGFALHGARALKFAVFWGLFFLIVGFSKNSSLADIPYSL